MKTYIVENLLTGDTLVISASSPNEARREAEGVTGTPTNFLKVKGEWK